MSVQDPFQLDSYTTATSSITGRIIYINESPDKFLVSPDPDYGELRKATHWWNQASANLPTSRRVSPRFRKGVEQLGECNRPCEIAKTLNQLLNDQYDGQRSVATVKMQQSHVVQLLVRLWSSGIIAWPAISRGPLQPLIFDVKNPGLQEHTTRILGHINRYLDRGATEDGAAFRFLFDHLLSRVGIVEIGDITPETMYFTRERTRLKRRFFSNVAKAILSALREEHYEHAINLSPEHFGFFQNKMGRLARDENFNWLTDADPDMRHWANLCIEHLEKNRGNYKKRKAAMNVFMRHFLENPELPRNPMQYFDIRKKPHVIFNILEKSGRQTMGIIREFLDEVLNRICVDTDDNETPTLIPGFAIPIPKRSYKGINKGETHREVMPTRLINLAARILTEDDFALAKEIGRLKDTFFWLNPETNELESVWSPVRAYGILLKLMLPMRTFQMRVLDSGEGDTLRYTSTGKWITNDGNHRPPVDAKVQNGVFRRYVRKDKSDGCVLFFNTNKTNDIDDEEKGFVMQWEHRDALSIMVKLRDWQEKYNPIKAPTPWTEILEFQRDKHIDDLKKMGLSFFLFRDPTETTRPDLPLTDGRLRGLWLRLMDEMERRLAESGQTMSNGQPIKLILTRDIYGYPSSAVFDLHGLRVSIITALYEEGVPIEFIMKIVGHQTVLMTLYYTKISPEALSRRLDEAVAARQKKAQAEMAGFVSRATLDELKKAVAYNHPSALEAANSATGLGFLVMDHGICSTCAKRCHEGLVAEESTTATINFLPVPGGASNCVRCRFFITGPAFLFGMEAHVNDIFYRLRKASETFEDSQNNFDRLVDEQAEAIGSGKPFTKQRELEIAETAFEASTAAVDELALSAHAGYRLVEQCIHLSHKRKKGEVTLVAAGGVHEIEAVLSDGHEFDQLNRICTAATIYDGLNIDWLKPNLERSRLFDRMLRNSGLDARFFMLDDKTALRVANAMGDFLYSRLPPDTVHALIDGKTTLQAIGLEKSFIQELKRIEPKKVAGMGLLERVR